MHGTRQWRMHDTACHRRPPQPSIAACGCITPQSAAATQLYVAVPSAVGRRELRAAEQQPRTRGGPAQLAPPPGASRLCKALIAHTRENSTPIAIIVEDGGGGERGELSGAECSAQDKATIGLECVFVPEGRAVGFDSALLVDAEPDEAKLSAFCEEHAQSHKGLRAQRSQDNVLRHVTHCVTEQPPKQKRDCSPQ